MADQYIGEIRIFGGTFAPEGWLNCDGSLQSISQYETLYALLGTAFGGDGVNTFGLPDLRGRLAVGSGAGIAYAQSGGSEQVSLNGSQVPVHSHALSGSASTGNTANPSGAALAAAGGTVQYYTPASSDDTVSLSSSSIGVSGGGQPHDNVMPFIALNYIISWTGIYPSQG